MLSLAGYTVHRVHRAEDDSTKQQQNLAIFVTLENSFNLSLPLYAQFFKSK